MSVCRIIEHKRTTANKTIIRLCVQQVLAHHNIQGTVTIIFTSLRHIATLNQQFKGINKPTDVLSFPNQDQPPNTQEAYLGEIVICPSYIHAQDKDWEVYHLVVHGMFHLIGIHHEHIQEDIHAQEVEILDSILKTDKSF